MKKFFQRIGPILLLLFAILPSWLIKNDRVIDLDEPRWIVRGANFYYAVTHGEFEKTIFEYHPGVTNMWVIGTGMYLYFPEYRKFEQGYFDPQKQKFEEFMRNHGKEALEVVRYSRYIHAGVLAILAVTAFLLLRLVINPKASFISIALAVLSPFYLGHSRVMNLEGMLSLYTLVSFLGLQVYLYKDRKIAYLLLSGAAFGLSQLTKSSSIVFISLVGLMLLVELFKRNQNNNGANFWSAIKVFIIWLSAAILIYFALWPGMWVAPGKMLYEVYGNAFSYALQGARLDVTKQLNPDSFGITSSGLGIVQFLHQWFISSTIITWLGLVFAFIFGFGTKQEPDIRIKSTIIYLTILGVLFIVMFGLAQGRNSQHYILSTYVAFDVIAGIGWYLLITNLQIKGIKVNTHLKSNILIGLLIAGQIASGLPYAPYYFNYKSPFASTPATYGYGEGYSEAAEYLAKKPNAHELRAYVYNGMGTFSYFFPGKTLVFKRIYLVNKDFETIVNDIKISDYLVLYPVTRGIQPETEPMYLTLKTVQPEKTITINGVEYVTIYKVSDIPETVYEDLLQQ